jgi:hypothetical protein
VSTTGPATTGSGTGTTDTSPPDSTGPTTTQAADLAAALLQPADVGKGFTASSLDPNLDDLPCGKPAVEKVVKEVGRADVELDDSANVFLDQTLYRYASEDDAKAAVQAGASGFSCATGSQDSGGGKVDFTITPKTISGLGDQVLGWTAHVVSDTDKTQVLDASIVVVRKGPFVTTLSMAVPPDQKAPDFDGLAAKAATRMSALS